jgi:pentatricopeptide repeat protein
LAASLSSGLGDDELFSSSVSLDEFDNTLVQEALSLQAAAMALVQRDKTERVVGHLLEVIKMLDSRQCDQSTRYQLSEIIETIVQSLCAKTFVKSAKYSKVLHGVNALQLQLNSSGKLSRPYRGVPKRTLSQALHALSSTNERQLQSASQTRAKLCFRILQRLITGVGVRQQKGQADVLHEREINQVLNIFSNSGQMDMAHRIVALQERTRHAPPLSPVSYSILVKGYGRLGDLKHVEEVLNHAMKNNVKPDVVLLNTILDAYHNCNDPARAQVLFDQMRKQEAANGSAELFPGTVLPLPNRRSYNTMLKGFAAIGDYKNAVTLAEELDERLGWDAVTINTLTRSAVMAKEFEAAEHLLAKHTVDFEKPASAGDAHPNVEAYTQLLDGYAKEGDMEKAVSVMQTMRLRGVLPNVVTYTCLIAGFGRNNQLDEAKRLLSYMKERGPPPSVITYNALISGLVEGSTGSSSDGKTWKMVDVVNDCLDLLRDMINSNIRPNSVTGALIVEEMSLCEPPKIEAATALVKSLEKQKLLAVGDKQVYTAVIKACGRANDTRRAVEYFRKVSSPDVIMVNAFMDACNLCKQHNVVKDTFNHFFQQKATKYNLRPDLITFSVLIKSALHNGDTRGLREAESLYNSMKRKWMILPDTVMVDTLLKATITLSRSKSLSRQDVLFVASILRDAEHLNWAEGQLERRRRAIRSILGDRLREALLVDKRMSSLMPPEEDVLFRRKGWNKVDSGFRLWGQASSRDTFVDMNREKPNGEAVDEFLESHGWNNVDSGFRLL